MSNLNYRSLSPTEKAIYNKLNSELKSFRLSVTFNGVESQSIFRAYKALLEDNPIFFWLSGESNCNWTTLNGVIQDITCTFGLSDGVTQSNIRSMYSALISEIRSITRKARLRLTHYEKILFVHDYIVDSTDYISHAPRRYNAYGCLVDHKAVCAGYAKAFQLIMEELGYECGYVRGSDVRENTIHSTHAWNYIKIENEYYFIDVTWDDPKVENFSFFHDNKTHNYFCIPAKELALTHKISQEYNYPMCNGTKYNYHLVNKYFLNTYSFSALRDIAARQLRRSRFFTVKFSSKGEAARAMADLIENRRVHDIPGVSRSICYDTSKSGLIITIYNN